MDKLAKNLPEIGVLWALRCLVRLDGYKQFLAEDGFMDDALARTLGLGQYIPESEQEGDMFNRHKMLTKLRFKLKQMEACIEPIRVPTALAENVCRLQAMTGMTDTECRILEFGIMAHGMRDIERITELPPSIRPAEVAKHISIYLGIPVNEVLKAVNRQSLMVRSGLFCISGNETFLPSLCEHLKLVSYTFAEQMLSANCDFEQIFHDMVTPGKKSTLKISDFYHIKDQVEILCHFLSSAVKERKQGANVLIWGAPGVGKSALAQVVADVIGLPLYEIASEGQDGAPLTGDERFRAYTAAQSFLCHKESLFVFDEVEDVFGGNRFLTNLLSSRDHNVVAGLNKAWINNTLETNPTPTVWISNSVHGTIDPAHARRFSLIIEMPIAPQEQRWRMIKDMSQGLLNDETVNLLSQSENLAPAVVSRAIDVIKTIEPEMAQKKASAWTKLMINATLEAQSHQSLPNSGATPSMDYDPAFVNANYDLTEVAKGLARSNQGRLLLMGPPGCGKSGYATWLASQLGRPLHAKKGSDLLGAYVGESEKNIAKAFKEAQEAEAILLIDEVDSFLAKRSNASHNWEVSLVNQVLVEMSDFNGYLVATTNINADQLDPAALRRFDLKANFDYLRPEQMLAMVEKYCVALGLAVPDVAHRQLLAQLHKLTPGDFAVIANQAKFIEIASTDKFIEALTHEHNAKAGAHAAMGFLN